MPMYKEFEIPDEAKTLFASAEAGEITPKDFCAALEALGISGVRAMFYVSRAFDLPLEAAKTLIIENEYGSSDAWADAWVDALDNSDLPIG